MVEAVTSARYGRLALSRLSLTNFPLESLGGIVRSLNTTTALVIANLAPSYPVENALYSSLTIWTLHHL